MIAATVAAGAIHVLAWLVDTCGQNIITKALTDGTAASCGEYWLNRYQSLIAGLVALFGAWLTVRTMLRQTGLTRADDADRRLSRYIAAIKHMIAALRAVQEWDGTPGSLERCQESIKAYERAADSPTIAEGMADGILGDDNRMLALLKNTADRRATGRFHRRETLVEDRLIDPLCFALLESLNRRQDRLRDGATVEDLRGLTLLDRREVLLSIREERSPNFE